MSLGNNIRKHREGLGLTLEALAERAGMAPGVLGAIERRDSKASKFTIAIAAALGVTPMELITGDPADSSGQNYETAKMIIELSRRIKKLTMDLVIESEKLSSLIDAGHPIYDGGITTDLTKIYDNPAEGKTIRSSHKVASVRSYQPHQKTVDKKHKKN